MNGEITDDNDIPEDDLIEVDLVEDDTASEEVAEADVLDSLNDDNVGDLSVELNVEELVANLESTDDTMIEQKREIRRKIEERRVQKEEELDGTYNFNLDEDL